MSKRKLKSEKKPKTDQPWKASESETLYEWAVSISNGKTETVRATDGQHALRLVNDDRDYKKNGRGMAATRITPVKDKHTFIPNARQLRLQLEAEAAEATGSTSPAAEPTPTA